jgi:RHS repeat-associated protein
MDSVETVLVDRRQSPYGSGWWPSTFAKLVASGNDRLLINANGSATIYRGTSDSIYLSPPGDFTILKKAGSTTELSERGRLEKVVFDNLGRAVKAVDRNGNRDSIIYFGASDTLYRLRDPLNADIEFYYPAGTLTGIVSPVGRWSAITIDGGNRLTVSTVLNGEPRPYTRRYAYNTSAGGSQILKQVSGDIADTTFIDWDATWLFPTQARLPWVLNETNTLVQPTTTYLPYERQGLTGARSLDSVYVEIKDPKSNWTRSLLNRYGQSLKTWDALGTISKSYYSPEGLSLWKEGKNGDSSRVYTAYDSLRRPTREYKVRAVGDTMLYKRFVYWDTNRPFLLSATIDPTGVYTSYGYDSKQNLSSFSTSTSSTIYTHDSYGQLIQVQEAGDTGKIKYDYYSGNRQLQRIRDQTNTTTDSVFYDQFGRDTLHYSRVRVAPNGGSYQYQWRVVHQKYASDNLVDTTTSRQSILCGPCTSPNALSDGVFWPTDSLYLRKVSRRYDIAGRDTVMMVTGRLGSRVSRDRLGRVRATWPWMDSTTVVDSFYYDVAGNQVKKKTRRGYSITTVYDSRNRVQSVTIPTVGTLNSVYGGPQDQLSRVYYTGLVDSIGGVNGDLKWVYDSTGRLKSDTVYRGATYAYGTAYAYDTFERVSQVTNALGVWKTRYETSRGFADTLITPFADTITYTYDTKGRAIGPTIRNAGVRLVRAQKWTTSGQLDSITNTAYTTGGSPWMPGIYARADVDGPNMPVLVPSWRETRGSGGTTYNWSDSIGNDAWGRVRAWISKRGSTLMIRDTFSFDANNNLKTKSFGLSGNETYNKLDQQTGRYSSTGACTYVQTSDRDGNITQGVCTPVSGSATTYVYAYNAINQLVSVRRNGTLIARYAYDALGRRIAKRVYSTASGGVTGYTRFVQNGDHVAFETDSAGTVGQQYTWGLGVDDLIALRASSTTYYVVQDQLKSVRGLFAAGTWRASMTYDPYGEAVDSASTSISGVTLRYRWVGREYDQETKFYHMRARYYSVGQSRFIQEDPLGPAGGTNRYAYAAGKVQSARDPTGLYTYPVYESQPTHNGNCMDWDGSISGCGGGPQGMGGGGAGGSHLEDDGYLDALMTALQGKGQCKNGTCPGGLTEAQYDRGIKALAYLKPEVAGRLATMLSGGKITSKSYTGPESRYATGLVDVSEPGVIVINATHDNGHFVMDAFFLNSVDLAFTLAHELRHVDQFATVPRYEDRVNMVRQFRTILDDDANSFACQSLRVPYMSYGECGLAW